MGKIIELTHDDVQNELAYPLRKENGLEESRF